MSNLTPNRIVAAAVALLGVVVLVAGIVASLAVPAAVAAVIAGAGLIAVPVREWLIGWREHERRQGEGDEPVGWEDLREILERVATGEAEPLAALRAVREQVAKR